MTGGQGEMCNASGWLLQFVPRGLSFCRGEHGFAAEFVSITILTLKYLHTSCAGLGKTN